jgi:hypothetical protein
VAEVARSPARKEEVRALASYRDDLDGGPGCLAALVTSAIEAVEAWQKAGLEVGGRRWADLGGGSGHYALALLLAGAAHVTLLDESAPGPWATPVLAAAGIDVVVGDASALGVPEADAALLLYTSADPLEVLEAHPGLRLLVASDLDPEANAVLEKAGWKVSEMRVPMGCITMSDGCAVPGYEGPDLAAPLYVYRGETALVYRGETGLEVPWEGEQLQGEVLSEDPAGGSAGYDENEVPF